MFEPGGFELYWELRRRAGSIRGESGITPEELKTLCAQCVKCKNFVSRSTHLFHKCPDVTTANEGNLGTDDTKADKDDIFQRLEHRLDAVGDGAALHGLTEEEFENLFLKCMSCGKIVTEDAKLYHCCFSFR